MFPFLPLLLYSYENYESWIGLQICVITAGIKKYKTIIKRKNKRNDETVLLAKSQLSSIEVLIFKAWIDSNISLDKFVLINNVLKEFYDI